MTGQVPRVAEVMIPTRSSHWAIAKFELFKNFVGKIIYILSPLSFVLYFKSNGSAVACLFQILREFLLKHNKTFLEEDRNEPTGRLVCHSRGERLLRDST